jgi:hypothetical protein
MLVLLLPLAAAPYGWTFSDEENTVADPWTPCERSLGVAVIGGAEVVRGFCRLSCTARWSYAPERMDCKMLPLEDLLARSHSRGLERFRLMSQDSFSEVNSGVSSFASNAPEE